MRKSPRIAGERSGHWESPTHGNLQPMPGGLFRTRDLCNRRGPRGGASLPPRLGACLETRAHAPL